MDRSTTDSEKVPTATPKPRDISVKAPQAPAKEKASRGPSARGNNLSALQTSKASASKPQEATEAGEMVGGPPEGSTIIAKQGFPKPKPSQKGGPSSLRPTGTRVALLK